MKTELLLLTNEETYAIDGDGKIDEIKNGIFYGGISTGNSIDTPTKLETNLNTSQEDKGSARYYHKEQEFGTVDESQMFLKGILHIQSIQLKKATPTNIFQVFIAMTIRNLKQITVFFKDTNDKSLNEDGEYFFWAGSPLGYFDNTNKKASYSSRNNNWYDDEKNGIMTAKGKNLFSIPNT